MGQVRNVFRHLVFDAPQPLTTSIRKLGLDDAPQPGGLSERVALRSNHRLLSDSPYGQKSTMTGFPDIRRYRARFCKSASFPLSVSE